MILWERPACKEQNWTKGQRTTKWLAQPARGNVLNHQTAFHARQQYGVPIQGLPALSNQACRSAATEIQGCLGQQWLQCCQQQPTSPPSRCQSTGPCYSRPGRLRSPGAPCLPSTTRSHPWALSTAQSTMEPMYCCLTCLGTVPGGSIDKIYGVPHTMMRTLRQSAAANATASFTQPLTTLKLIKLHTKAPTHTTTCLLTHTARPLLPHPPTPNCTAR